MRRAAPRRPEPGGRGEALAAGEAFGLRWSPYTLMGVITLTILLMVAYTQFRAYRMTRLHAPMAAAASEIKAEGALSHLWLEEALSGDPHETMDAVSAHLARAEARVKALIQDSGRSGAFRLWGAGEPSPAALRELRTTLAELREVTRIRQADPAASVPGSDIDQRYDAVFARFMRAVQAFEASVHESIRRDLSAFRQAQLLVVSAGLVLMTLVGILFHRFETDRASHLLDLRAAKEGLERRVEERTDALRNSNRRLADAKDEAELASRVKDEFLEHMSHDLMTPLNSILGYTDLLLDQVEGTLTEEQRDSLRKVHGNAARLLCRLEGILELSSLVSRPRPAERSIFSPDAAVRDLVKAVTPAAARKGLRLDHVTRPGVPDAVEGDAGRLGKALSLLLEDAVCEAASGQVTVTVTAAGDDTEVTGGGNVQLQFSIRGPHPGAEGHQGAAGLQDNVACREPDGRLERATSLRFAVASHLVKGMGGHLRVEGDPGRGGTVHVFASFAR